MKRSYAAALLLAMVGCDLQLPPPQNQESLFAIEVSPTGPIPSGAPVFVRWTGASLEGPVALIDESGTEVEARIEAIEDGLVLSALSGWPAGGMKLDFLQSLRDAKGAPISLVLTFEVRKEAVMGVVRRPVPGQLAPANLEWLAVEADTESLRFVSTSSDTVRATRFDAWTFSLEGESCPAMCPVSTYVLLEPPSTGPTATVRTSSISDFEPPALRSVRATAQLDLLQIEVEASEVVRGLCAWSTEDLSGSLYMLSVPDPRLRLVADPSPPDGSTADLQCSFFDFANNEARWSGQIAMPISVQIELNEVVLSPLRDWGDSEPNGEPFDSFPGLGAVTSSDEWVELVHRGARAIDLTEVGLTVEVWDSSPSETSVLEAPFARFADGGDFGHWSPGEALVLRLRGQMSSTELSLVLRAGHRKLHELVISPGGDHPGGRSPDPRFEAIGRRSDGSWAWCIPTPGQPTPSQLCINP